MGRKHKTIVTYLEMLSPNIPPGPHPGEAVAIMRAHCPPVHFYRYLYDAVGRHYLWVDRKRLSGEALAEIIHDENVEIYVLLDRGCPAGYLELDFRDMPDVNIAYFGLIPEFQGRGLGRFFLAEACHMAWGRGPERITVDTCTLDHAGALPLYQRLGFTVCGREEGEIEELDDVPVAGKDTE